MGYSLGGATALRLAIDHPEVVDRLVLLSAAYAFTGWQTTTSRACAGSRPIRWPPPRA